VDGCAEPLFPSAMKRVFLSALLIIASGLLRTPPAAGVQAALQVSARVLPYLQVDLQHQESILRISGENIRQGFVDIASATVFHVRTNRRDGYTLSVENHGNWINRVWLKDGGRTVELPPEGGVVRLPYHGGQRGEKKVFDIRFFLNENATAGSYPWPLSFHKTDY